MPVFYPGNIISSSEPSPGSGMWSMTTHMQKQKAGTWPATTPGVVLDSEFEYTTLLLKAVGSNTQQNYTFLDSSTNAFTITRNGETTQGSFSPYGIDDGEWSVYFDGSGDYLSSAAGAATPCAFGTNDFTIEMWAYFNVLPTNASDYIVFFDTRATSSSGLYTTITLKGSTLVYYSNGADRITSGTITAGKWYHIALTRNGASTRLFINGVQAGSTYADSSSYICASGRPYIGGDGNANGGFYNGYLSNVRVINGTALYTSSFTPSITPLTAISGTALLTCQSNRFRDSSTNNFAITRNGDAKISAFTAFNQSGSYSGGTYGGAIYFDGNGDYLQIANDAKFNLSSSNFTIEAWIYPTATPTDTAIFIAKVQGAYPSAYEWSFNMGTGLTPALGFFGSTFGAVNSSAAIPVGSWSHVAVVRSGSVITIYVNGVASGTTTAQTIQTTSSAVTVGRDLETGTSSPRYFTGYLSDVRVVKGTAVYTSNFTPPTAPVSPTADTSILLSGTNAGIIDASRKSILYTLGNTKVSTNVVKYDKSIFFDGTGDYIVIPNSQDLLLKTSDFTIEMWIRFNSVADGQAILTKGWSTINAPFLFYVDGVNSKISFYASSSASSWDVANAIAVINSPSTGQWYHMAVTRSGSTFRTFNNGTQVSTFTSSSSLADAISYPVTIGGSTTGSNFTNCYIEDLRITRGVARYTAAFTPPTETMPTA